MKKGLFDRSCHTCLTYVALTVVHDLEISIKTIFLCIYHFFTFVNISSIHGYWIEMVVYAAPTDLRQLIKSRNFLEWAVENAAFAHTLNWMSLKCYFDRFFTFFFWLTTLFSRSPFFSFDSLRFFSKQCKIFS